ncbi:6-hydroxymethylpterin diphosphokinase MptE-like protein [Candidatus Uabimicrobium amorphum]|uniref:6-hydroxymethylpterin diphosphokinase MptE-like domain-containing protein n=2 Tax=Uabimicrobium amorphum TaxID=2596890 RepID=A0A5S9IWN2_UABAM|nr:hypothetical protein UABAM_06310 [Candidatus Uabimicrobium amorphum]
MSNISAEFKDLVKKIPQIGIDYHLKSLCEKAVINLPLIKKSLKDISLPEEKKAESAIVISAGPSVHNTNAIQKIVDSGYQGTIIAIDGTYVRCLKAGLKPDYIITLDPHPTRVVRWFGDPDFEKNSENDDYFARQDLDVDFRKNSIKHNNENIELVNKFSAGAKVIIASCISETVANRLVEANFDGYWFNPMVDNPTNPESITRKMWNINKLPCMNTGGTVGTAAWVFAATRLKIPHIAVVGMDFGYPESTPIEKTQTYYELINHLGSKENIKSYFAASTFPLTGEKYYTDPTYYWYKQNFIDLLRKVDDVVTYNCSGAGTLIEEEVECMDLNNFLGMHKEEHCG